MISGVILAAGRSQRLGKPKQLLDLGGEPILRHTVRNAAVSDLDQVVLVLGHEAAEIDDAVGDWGQNLVINPDYARGQSTSLKLGLSAVEPTAEAVLFLLGDQPQVTPKIINLVLNSFCRGEGRIVMPAYRGKPANPVLFAREFFPEIAAIDGDRGARPIIGEHRQEVHYLAIDADPPLDVDTPADYERLKKVWK
ncbi:MAG: NTP transferase domain-containing protein [Thermomicrobiales bacterium]